MQLTIRLGEAGGTFTYDPTAWLIHLHAPAGGLRMSDANMRRSEKEKIYASMLFFVKYGSPPWCQPAVWCGLLQAWREAKAACKRGAWSRFTR